MHLGETLRIRFFTHTRLQPVRPAQRDGAKQVYSCSRSRRWRDTGRERPSKKQADSSDIAFTMGARGLLLEKAASYEGEIPLYL